MSRIFAAYSAGGLIGPALGAINVIHGPFLAYAALVGCALALSSLLPTPGDTRQFASDRSALQLPGFWAASAAILFTVLALGVVEGVLPLLLSRHLDQTEIGLLSTRACPCSWPPAPRSRHASRRKPTCSSPPA